MSVRHYASLFKCFLQLTCLIDMILLLCYDHSIAFALRMGRRNSREERREKRREERIAEERRGEDRRREACYRMIMRYSETITR